MIYILGCNSFIAKNLYIRLKQNNHKIILLSHSELNMLKDISDDDIIINCCGVNRADNKTDFENGNYIFVKEMYKYLEKNPYLIHFSSLMVNGFKNNDNTVFENLSDGQRWFIESKLKGDNFLLNNYDKNKLCIIRPSNIYGYNCKSYYNNILSTMVYEKIHKLNKINKINKNCYRNMISIDSVIKRIIEILEERKTGIHEIVSNNTISLEEITNIIYKITDDKNDIQITDETYTIPIIHTEDEITEDLVFNINKLEHDMIIYYNLIEKIDICKCAKLSQSRGDMVEMSNLEGKRLYKITINQNEVRGNHYHIKQIEDFFVNSGKVVFILALSDHPDIIHNFTGKENELIRIKPGIIHTVSNDFINNIPEIIIISTQRYDPNSSPDTEYIKLL